MLVWIDKLAKVSLHFFLFERRRQRVSIFNKVYKRGIILIRLQATEFSFNFGSHSFAELKRI